MVQLQENNRKMERELYHSPGPRKRRQPRAVADSTCSRRSRASPAAGGRVSRRPARSPAAPRRAESPARSFGRLTLKIFKPIRAGIRMATERPSPPPMTAKKQREPGVVPAPTTFHSSSIRVNGNPDRISRNGDTVRRHGSENMPQASRRCGTSAFSGPQASGSTCADARCPPPCSGRSGPRRSGPHIRHVDLVGAVGRPEAGRHLEAPRPRLAVPGQHQLTRRRPRGSRAAPSFLRPRRSWNATRAIQPPFSVWSSWTFQVVRGVASGPAVGS